MVCIYHKVTTSICWGECECELLDVFPVFQERHLRSARPGTDPNCVTNIPLKVIIQLGQRGIQQIMVDEGDQHVLM